MRQFVEEREFVEEDFEDAPDEDVPREYKEGRLQQCCLRCCGNACWVVLALCIVAWVTHSFAVEGTSSLADAPAFSKTLIWRSLAHHTDAWDEWKTSVSPPPPSFSRLR